LGLAGSGPKVGVNDFISEHRVAQHTSDHSIQCFYGSPITLSSQRPLLYLRFYTVGVSTGILNTPVWKGLTHREDK
jgi:hypothetical protein